MKKQSAQTQSRPKPKARKKPEVRKSYTRAPAACTARQIGWDGVRSVTMQELCNLAGVGYYQLRLDRVKHSLLEAPLPKQQGVRQPIWSAAAAKRYLKQKKPRGFEIRLICL